eukprot:GEMP01033920.1.p1 GENE.GEMP01033920.1~~GEMP01033920.1.p1  ORF type:complete len:101 (+),score=13.44 GEMP01033920.1:467-769(+)
MLLFAGIFGMEPLLRHFAIPVPDLVKKVSENRFATFMVIWLFGNSIQGGLLSTGAFEMYNGHVKIWSSLEHNRLPTHGDIMAAFERSGIECVSGHAVRTR